MEGYALGQRRQEQGLRFDGDLQLDPGMERVMHFNVPHSLQPTIFLSLACRQSRFGGVANPHVISFDSATDERRDAVDHAYRAGAFMQAQCERQRSQSRYNSVSESAEGASNATECRTSGFFDAPWAAHVLDIQVHNGQEDAPDHKSCG